MIRSWSFAAILVLVLAHTSPAAEIRWLGIDEDLGSRVSTLRLEGSIEQGDSERFLRAVNVASDGIGTWDSLIIELSSPGGSYPEGLRLAEAFRRKGVATVVKSGDYCYSACAIAFLGGAERLRDVETASTDGLPGQPPDRSLEPGAELGFHAPYLVIPDDDYTAANVEEAYRLAVDSISMLVALSDHLFVDPAELPRLLAPGRDDAFMVDDVDALRSLWITYTDYRLQPRDLVSITQSMVTNACVNRWYHGKRRSALPGYALARAVSADFEMGSSLLGNGESGLSFGARKIAQGTVQTWLAYLPVAMTEDGKNFVWCVFDSGLGSPRVMYRAAGTVAELFEPIEENWDIWAFQSMEGLLLPTEDMSISQTLRVLDMVPSHTKLVDVARAISSFQALEPSLGELAE